MEDDGVSILIYRNKIVISGYNIPKCQGWLPNIYRVFDSRLKRYDNNKTFSYRLPNGDIIIPRTADIQPIINKLTSQNIGFNGIFNKDNTYLIPIKYFTKKMNIKPKFPPNSEFQRSGIQFLCENMEDNIHYRLLSLPTGEGKTICALYAMCYYNRKTLIVANKLTKQWVDEILEKVDCNYTKIIEVTGVDAMERLLSNRANSNSYDIFITTSQTLYNACQAGIYEKFCNKFGIGLKIVDEIHLSTYTNLYIDMMAPIQETIYLSATPARSNPAEDWNLKRVFKNLPQYGIDVKYHKKKYLNTVYIFYDTKPNYNEVSLCLSIHGFKLIEYERQIFSLKSRCILFNIISFILDTFLPKIDSDEKIAFIFELTETVKLINKFINEKYPNLSVGDYTSNVDKKVKTDSLKNTIILSTDKSFGTGSDLKGKLRMLVNFISFNSKVAAEQVPGRLRDIPDKKVYYVDLVNMGYKRCFDHYLNRSKIINRFSANVQKINFQKEI